MREIKLRFIIKDQRDDSLRSEDWLLEEYGKGMPYLKEYEIVHDRLQFTGLKDKNGKDIYEGDIINVELIDGEENKKTIVEWHKGGFFPLTLYATRCEVIGNIYENPELLTN